MPKLVVKHPDKGEISFTLSGERITVGRSEDNKIQINHGTVSGHHAELVASNGGYVIEDLNSTNHSFIDGNIVAKAPLERPCKVAFGDIECDFVPDDADPAREQMDSLRKTVGLLRQQNDELTAKISEQQGRINILANARLFTPAAGADMVKLRDKVKSLTAARDRFATENQALRNAIERLSAIAEECSDSESPNETPTVRGNGRSDAQTATIPVAPDAPTNRITSSAKLVEPSSTSPYQKIADYNQALQSLVALLIQEPVNKNAVRDLLLVASQIAEAGRCFALKPVASISGDLYRMVHGASLRAEPLGQRILETIAQASGFLANVLSRETVARVEHLPSPKIIAVDDDKDVLPAIVASLEFASLPTIGCADAKEALSALQEISFDLILLDIGLPDLNGLDTCSSIRAMPRHHHTPIVFLTGDDSAENRSRGLRQGGSDFIGKPFNIFELTLKAHTWVLKNQLAAA